MAAAVPLSIMAYARERMPTAARSRREKSRGIGAARPYHSLAFRPNAQRLTGGFVCAFSQPGRGRALPRRLAQLLPRCLCLDVENSPPPAETSRESAYLALSPAKAPDTCAPWRRVWAAPSRCREISPLAESATRRKLVFRPPATIATIPVTYPYGNAQGSLKARSGALWWASKASNLTLWSIGRATRRNARDCAPLGS